MTTNAVKDAVVLGYDGTPRSDAALDWAARYAMTHGRPLLIAYAAGVPTAYDSFSGIQENREDLRVLGQQVLDAAVARIHELAPGLTVHTHVALRDGARPYARFSGADRGVNQIWWRRWKADGMFCVLFSATDAYCEIDGPKGVAIFPRSAY